MRILHTADWHFGRTLEGRSRLPEQIAFVDELVEIVNAENIDLILMAGDVYDTYNPSAEAEELFYESLARLTDHGKRKMICIAGNHDHPDRLVASTPLAKHQGIYLVGLPNESIIDIYIPRTEERAHIYALPYPSEARLRKVLSEEIEEEILQMAYDTRIAQMFAQQKNHFTDKTINLAMSHLFVQGGLETESEREIQVGGAYTVSPQSLPAYTQYVALGHLHRPQTVNHAPTCARYSGSPLAYSFSEAGQAKSVTLLDLKAKQTASPQLIHLRCGKPLVTWEAKEGIEQVYRWLDEGRDPHAWINLDIHVTDALPTEVIHKIRKSHSGLIHVHPIYPELVAQREQIRIRHMSAEELFHRFYQKQTNGAEPEVETTKLFLELIGEEEEENATHLA